VPLAQSGKLARMAPATNGEAWWSALPDSAWLDAHPLVHLAGECLLTALAGLLVWWVGDRIVRRLSAHLPMAPTFVRFTRSTVRILLPLLFVQVSLADADPAFPKVRHWVAIAVILLVTTLIVRLIQAAAQVVEDRHPVNVPSNLQAREIQTKTRVLARIAMFVVGLIGMASVLMTFPAAKQLGASLLASAGVAGIAAGLAARPVLGNLIAGIQIALTQPIRIDDVLIVENEWGRVEEITMTYVVIRIWDDRRLVVPLEYFIEKPFQNWTRQTSDLIGSVFFWVDYRMPIPPLREALQRICAETPLWDGRLCLLQVTDISERAAQLRVLVSSRDANTGWDLRCLVREQLLAFMHTTYPEHLPQLRAGVLGSQPDAPHALGAHERPSTGPGTRQVPITP